jgi:predicted RNA-binding Zn-ribbon protein involved in translation (DUF1610 family)
MNERIQNRLADLKARQLAGEHLPCPRCGMDTMKDALHTNALSRHADIYICDLCGNNEAMLDFMRNPLPVEDWSCMLKHNDGFQPDTIEMYIDTITSEHIHILTALYRRWLDEQVQDDFRAYRDEARKRCPGLTELWTQPFQAEYRAKDGSRALVRFRIRDGDIQYSVDVIPK